MKRFGVVDFLEEIKIGVLFVLSFRGFIIVSFEVWLNCLIWGFCGGFVGILNFIGVCVLWKFLKYFCVIVFVLVVIEWGGKYCCIGDYVVVSVGVFILKWESWVLRFSWIYVYSFFILVFWCLFYNFVICWCWVVVVNEFIWW